MDKIKILKTSDAPLLSIHAFRLKTNHLQLLLPLKNPSTHSRLQPPSKCRRDGIGNDCMVVVVTEISTLALSFFRFETQKKEANKRTPETGIRN